jgi:ATP-dependent Clp protease ATP-binding subunit ClpC
VHRRDDARRVPQVHREGRRPDRRFQPITVEPPSKTTRSRSSRACATATRRTTACRFTDEALEAASKLSDRYITGRCLPDKAIDVMDEAGARVRLRSMTKPPDLADSKSRSSELRRKEKAVAEQDFEEAAKLRDKEKQLRAKKEQSSASGARRPRK